MPLQTFRDTRPCTLSFIFMHNTDKTNRIEQNPLKDQENEFGEVLSR